MLLSCLSDCSLNHHIISSRSATWSLLWRNRRRWPLNLPLCVWLLMETTLLWGTTVKASNSSVLIQVCLCEEDSKSDRANMNMLVMTSNPNSVCGFRASVRNFTGWNSEESDTCCLRFCRFSLYFYFFLLYVVCIFCLGSFFKLKQRYRWNNNK